MVLLEMMRCAVSEQMIVRKLAKKTDKGSIYYYHFLNQHGSRMTVTNYGAAIVALSTADAHGEISDVVLGMDSIDDYLRGTAFLGSTVGRFANRIDKGIFSLNGKSYELNTNDGMNHLHGGFMGFDKRVWRGEIIKDALIFKYHSPDGEEKYPGDLDVEIQYRLTNDNAVDIIYRATAGADTIVNLSNHTYFNLNPDAPGVTDHLLFLDADQYTPVDNELIPTGEISSVSGTVLDFRVPKRIGTDIEDHDLKQTRGYDHNLILNGEGFRLVGKLMDAETGRIMSVFTDQPAIQVYTGQNLGPNEIGRLRKPRGAYPSLCLETQLFPDAPNHDNFPSAVLKAGDTYVHHTRYQFTIVDDKVKSQMLV